MESIQIGDCTKWQNIQTDQPTPDELTLYIKRNICVSTVLLTFEKQAKRRVSAISEFF